MVEKVLVVVSEGGKHLVKACHFRDQQPALGYIGYCFFKHRDLNDALFKYTKFRVNAPTVYRRSTVVDYLG